MGTISGRDASAFCLIRSATLLVSNDYIGKILAKISDPEVIKASINVRLSKLKEVGISEEELKKLNQKYLAILAEREKTWTELKKVEAEKEEFDQQQFKMSGLALKCMQFVDKNPDSKIIDRGSHPFSRWLQMQYQSENFSIQFRRQESGYSNGSQWVKVKVGRKTVFELNGPVMGIEGQKVKKYIPGDWEKRIR